MTRSARVRKDVAALSSVVASRALAPRYDARDGGACYVIPGHEDDPFFLHRVTSRAVVVRSRRGGFLSFAHPVVPVTEWWCPRPPGPRTRAEIDALLLHDPSRRGR